MHADYTPLIHATEGHAGAEVAFKGLIRILMEAERVMDLWQRADESGARTNVVNLFARGSGSVAGGQDEARTFAPDTGQVRNVSSRMLAGCGFVAAVVYRSAVHLLTLEMHCYIGPRHHTHTETVVYTPPPPTSASCTETLSLHICIHICKYMCMRVYLCN